MKYRLSPFMGEAKKINNIITIDNSMIPEDILLLETFFSDAFHYHKRYISQFLKMLEIYKGVGYNITHANERDGKIIIYADFLEFPDIILPKSEFLHLLDELAAAIDTGKDIWIEKSDEGKYRIWGE